MEINELLIDMRKKSGKSQQQMADHIGVSKRTYQGYEYNERDISAKDLFKLTQYCKYNRIVNKLEDFIKNFGDRDTLTKGFNHWPIIFLTMTLA